MTNLVIHNPRCWKRLLAYGKEDKRNLPRTSRWLIGWLSQIGRLAAEGGLCDFDRNRVRETSSHFILRPYLRWEDQDVDRSDIALLCASCDLMIPAIGARVEGGGYLPM